MGERAAATRKPLSRVGLGVLKNLPSGDMLDRAVALYRPRPEILGAAPGENLLRTLRLERNLYAACLEAATGDPVVTLGHPDSTKDRVRRALAHNPRLSEAQRSVLATAAVETKSAPLALALLAGTTRITHTLTKHLELLNIVSVRAGQTAPQAVARNLHEASVDDIGQLRKHFEEWGNREDTPLRSIVLDATRLVLEDIRQGRRTSELDTLSALCSLVEPGATRGHLRLPSNVYAHLENLPGRTVLPIAALFVLDHWDEDDHLFPLTNAWHYEEDLALDCEFENEVRWWSDVAVNRTATLLAGKFTELAHLETFEVLLPEWVGTLRELIEVAVKL